MNCRRLAPIAFVMFVSSVPCRAASMGHRRFEIEAARRAATRQRHAVLHSSPLSNARLHAASLRFHPARYAVHPVRGMSLAASQAAAIRGLGYTPRDLDIHRSRLSNLRLYEGLVKLRNLDPYRFDRLHCHTLVAVLKSAQLMTQDEAELARNPRAFFRYEPFLTRILEGHEAAVLSTPPITPPSGPPHQGGGTGKKPPTAVSAPPSALLLSLGAGSLACVLRLNRRGAKRSPGSGAPGIPDRSLFRQGLGLAADAAAPAP